MSITGSSKTATTVIVAAVAGVLVAFGFAGSRSVFLQAVPDVDAQTYSSGAEGAEPVLEQLAESGLVQSAGDDTYSVDSEAVLELLGTVPVREDTGEIPGYSAEEFGPSWSDTDQNGCDQRNDVLTRDFEPGSIQYRDGTHGCVVIRGVLHDAYTGKEIHFTKEDASAVQIDHIVARSWAWQNGAAEWSAELRLEFATDLANLQAVDGPTNASKSDDGPGTGKDQWLPPNEAYTCMFLARFTYVVAEYELALPPADRGGIEEGLEHCGPSV